MSQNDQINLIYKEVLTLSAEVGKLKEAVDALKIVRGRWEGAVVAAGVSATVAAVGAMLGGC